MLFATLQEWFTDHWFALLTLAAGAVLGAVFKYFFDRRLRRQPSTYMTLKCIPTHHGFLSPGVQKYGHAIELRVDGKPVRDAGVVNYKLAYSGNAVIKNVKIFLRAEGGNGILNWHFYVPRGVMCERMKVIEDKPPHLRFEWAYLNPGDIIDFEVTLAPCLNPAQVFLEIDAEGLQVITESLKMNCPVPGSGPMCE